MMSIASSLRNGLSLVGLAWIVLVATLAPLTAYAKGPVDTRPTVIVLTASWCGSCREITPAVQRAIQSSPELGLRLVTLDVDDTAALGQASAYGITIAGSNVPQVFLFSNGRTLLMFNGQGYKFGQSRQVESKIMQALQGAF